MSAHRTYRGLHGEPIRVSEDTIAPAPFQHHFPEYPFAFIAERSGDKRDQFARAALMCPFISDVRKHPLTRAAFARSPQG